MSLWQSGCHYSWHAHCCCLFCPSRFREAYQCREGLTLWGAYCSSRERQEPNLFYFNKYQVVISKNMDVPLGLISWANVAFSQNLLCCGSLGSGASSLQLLLKKIQHCSALSLLLSSFLWSKVLSWEIVSLLYLKIPQQKTDTVRLLTKQQDFVFFLSLQPCVVRI